MLVDVSRENAVGVIASSMLLRDSVVRNTTPAGNGSLGDGIFVVSTATGPAQATIDNVLSDASARAGISSFLSNDRSAG
jgi:hypothetical protein